MLARNEWDHIGLCVDCRPNKIMVTMTDDGFINILFISLLCLACLDFYVYLFVNHFFVVAVIV